jgi:hypothetical protein
MFIEYNMSAKELKDKLKALRSLHSGKAVGKMSPEEISNEISHHETASRQIELKAKRLSALASAREAKKPVVVVEKKVKKEKKAVTVIPTVVEKPKKEKKAVTVIPTVEKKEKKIKKEKIVVESDTDSSTDEDTDTETIKKRISKKGLANGE